MFNTGILSAGGNVDGSERPIKALDFMRVCPISDVETKIRFALFVKVRSISPNQKRILKTEHPAIAKFQGRARCPPHASLLLTASPKSTT